MTPTEEGNSLGGSKVDIKNSCQGNMGGVFLWTFSPVGYLKITHQPTGQSKPKSIQAKQGSNSQMGRSTIYTGLSRVASWFPILGKGSEGHGGFVIDTPGVIF